MPLILQRIGPVMDGKMKPRAHQQAISGMGGKLQPHENRNDF